MRSVLVSLFAAAWCAVAIGQTAPPALKFDVVSVKPSPPPGGPGSGLAIAGIAGGPGSGTPDLVRAFNCDLQNFIIRAFNLTGASRVSSPDWTRNTKFDMTARVPDGTTTQEQVRLMLQDVLSERFGLEFHYETRETSGFNLVVGKGGPNLTKALKVAGVPDGPLPPPVPLGTVDKNGFPAINPTGYQNRGGRGANRARWVRETMERFAFVLAAELHSPVMDMTGLKDEYDFEMYWVDECPRRPDCETGVERPGWPTSPALALALEQQLGLKLVPVRDVPVQILVVDHIARVPTPN